MDSWHQYLPEGHEQQFDSREVIVAPGSGENAVFRLVSGRARTYLMADAREQTLGHLQVGSVFVTHTPVWVEAMEPTIIRRWPLRYVKELFSEQPEMALGAIREVGMLLYGTISIIEDLAFRSVDSRLARYLLTESQQQDSDTVKLIGNTDILASLLGTSRQTASTMLNRMIKQGLIAKPSRQCIQILDKGRLQQLSERLSAG